MNSSERRRLTILGSTGSIGLQALDVVRSRRDRFKVVGLSANSDAKTLERQAEEFGPDYVALESGDAGVLATPQRAGSPSSQSLPGSRCRAFAMPLTSSG